MRSVLCFAHVACLACCTIDWKRGLIAIVATPRREMESKRMLRRGCGDIGSGWRIWIRIGTLADPKELFELR